MNLHNPSDSQLTLETLREHYQCIVNHANAQLAHAELLLSKPVLSLNPLSVNPLVEVAKLAEGDDQYHDRLKILDLFGTIEYDLDYDYKQQRQRG
jgi:hypothetical protein